LTFALQLYFILNDQILLQSLYDIIKAQAETIAKLEAKVKELEAEILILKNKKNSNNSHIPPSKDENRAKKNKSLRIKTDNKVGGQLGHEGKTLECRTVVDEVVKHSPNFCNCCGKDLSDIAETLAGSRQVIDIPPIVLQCTEHQVYEKQCPCGRVMIGDFPSYVAAKVQYGPNTESLIGYLHARQYLPYHRMKEFLNDVMGLPVSVGGIHHILERLAQKAIPVYEVIKQQLQHASFVGTDETGLNVNGKIHWMWTWQNDDLTYLVCSNNRAFQTIADTCMDKLPNAVLQHDRYACHFKVEAKAHQICTAHLLRDLNYIHDLYDNQCNWATEFKELLLQAIQLKKEFVSNDYFNSHEGREQLFEKLQLLLKRVINEDYKKSISLQKKLLDKQNCILYFLLQPNVPPDNNGSERAIRNVKVKQKISGMFKSEQGANMFAVLRSVIDTTIKAGKNVISSLSLIAQLQTE
jgi:transposase